MKNLISFILRNLIFIWVGLIPSYFEHGVFDLKAIVFIVTHAFLFGLHEYFSIKEKQQIKICEWEFNRDLNNITNSFYKTDCYHEISLSKSYGHKKFKYCPYCRRTINIKE